jgi:hypothetical protein
MSAQKLESAQSCKSKRSIKAVEGGVIYASPDGLCLAGPASVPQLLTQGAFSRDDWHGLNLADTFGVFAEGVYYLFDQAGTSYSFDLAAKAIGTLDADAGDGASVTAAYADLLTDTIYVADGTAVKPMFQGASYAPAVWRSKVLVLNSFPSFGWLRVTGDEAGSVTVKLYGDGVLYSTSSVAADTPIRLPSRRHRTLEVQIEGSIRITKVTLAGSTEELMSV